LTIVRDLLHHRLLDLRRMEKLILALDFEILFHSADPDTRDRVLDWIREGSRNLVEKWFKEASRRDLDDLTVKELRRIAQEEQVSGYESMNKATLIFALGCFDPDGGHT